MKKVISWAKDNPKLAGAAVAAAIAILIVMAIFGQSGA